MPTIRGFLLDGVALAGVAIGAVAGVGGYLGDLPDPPERIAVAATAAGAYAEPETTGAITPRDPTAAIARPDGGPADDAATRSRHDDAVRIWVDPPRRPDRSRRE